MNRRSSTCDALVPRAWKDPPDKPLDSDAGQHDQGIVSEKMTSVMLRAPVNHPPVSEDTSLPIVKIRGDKDELPIKAAEALCPKDMELVHRVLEGPKLPEAAINLCQWAGQEVIGGEDSRILLCPPCSAVAFTLHMSALVNPTPAHSLLCPNMELEFQCRKPPDCGGEGWLAYNAVNEKVQTSVVKPSLLDSAPPSSPATFDPPPPFLCTLSDRLVSTPPASYRACWAPR